MVQIGAELKLSSAKHLTQLQSAGELQLKSAFFFPAPLGKNTSKLCVPMPGSLFRDWARCINITNVLSFKSLFSVHMRLFSSHL